MKVAVAPSRGAPAVETVQISTASVTVSLVILGALIAAIPLVVLEMVEMGYGYHNVAWVVAGGFTCATMMLCVWEINRQLTNFRNPMQRQVIRILWMPFIFALDSWLALRFKEVGLYLTAAAECYEGWTVNAFMALLRLFLEDVCDRPGGKALIESMKQPQHIFPFNFLSVWPIRHSPGESVLNGPFATKAQLGVIQYALVMPVLTLTKFIAQYNGVFREGQVRIVVVYPYVAAVRNVSQFTALYCLVVFFIAFMRPLNPFRPVFKFICVKSVVFLTYWQSMIVAGLVFIKVIRTNPSWPGYSAEEMGAGIQNFLVCVEMFFAAIAMACFFPPTDYHPPVNRERGPRIGRSRWMMLGEIFAVRDVLHDLRKLVRSLQSRVSPSGEICIDGEGTAGARAAGAGAAGAGAAGAGTGGRSRGDQRGAASAAGKGPGSTEAQVKGEWFDSGQDRGYPETGGPVAGPAGGGGARVHPAVSGAFEIDLHTLEPGKGGDGGGGGGGGGGRENQRQPESWGIGAEEAAALPGAPASAGSDGGGGWSPPPSGKQYELS